MPIDVIWDSSRSLWRFVTGESFTFDDIVRLTEKTDWNDASCYLWDLRELREGPDSTAQLQDVASLVERSRELWSGSRTAIMVSRDYDFGIARMFQVFTEGAGIEYAIFRDPDAALAWLAETSPDKER